MRVALVVVALAALAALAVVGSSVEAEVEWITPSFLEEAPQQRAWNKASSDEPHLAPVAAYNDAHESHSLMESQATAEARVDAMLSATVTAQGKTEAQLEAEIATRGPGLFAEFKARFKKTYTDETARLKTFLANLLRIAKLNAKAFFSSIPKRLRAVYTHLSEFADQTKEEFAQLMGATPYGRDLNLPIAPAAPVGVLAGKTATVVPTSGKVEAKVVNGTTSTATPVKTSKDAKSRTPKGVKQTKGKKKASAKKGKSFLEVETEVDVDGPPVRRNMVAPIDSDWRAKGTPIANQGRCSACWSFAATAALETLAGIAKSTPAPALSQQQLLDCVRLMDKTNGCKGGNPLEAIKWLQANGGQAAASAYPVTFSPTGSCTKTASGAGVVPSRVFSAVRPCAISESRGFSGCPSPDENELGHQLSSGGPLITTLDASSFQFYAGGVMADDTSCSKALDYAHHVVVIEGLSTDAATGVRSWILRNSWGESFGEKGRIRMLFGKNVCGLGNNVLKVTV